MNVMKAKIYEVWRYNGIPQTKPTETFTSFNELKNYLKPTVYRNTTTGEILGGEGEKVFDNEGNEIPLNKIFNEKDFYSNRQWGEICESTN